MDGIESHGPNGPLMPVLGRDLMMDWWILVWAGVIWDGSGPLQRGMNLWDVCWYLVFLCCTVFCICCSVDLLEFFVGNDLLDISVLLDMQKFIDRSIMNGC